MPDYRILLEKYIKHVGDCEGIDFITNRSSWKTEDFTDEEWKQLTRIANEVWAENELYEPGV